ncbi:hypothetical protein LG59_1539 [Serratia ureilytica]|nr:hypothetical protein LG59_1539 [Serratia ureilytica]
MWREIIKALLNDLWKATPLIAFYILIYLIQTNKELINNVLFR